MQIISQTLQQPGIDSTKTSGLCTTATHKIQEMRDNFEKVFEESKVLAKTWGVNPNFPKIRKKNSPRMVDKLNCDEREHDSEEYLQKYIFVTLT